MNPSALEGAYKCACSLASAGTRLANAAAGATLCPGSASTTATVPSCGARITNSCFASLSAARSEEHTSELQSQSNLVCRLLLEKKKKHKQPLQPSHLHHIVFAVVHVRTV